MAKKNQKSAVSSAFEKQLKLALRAYKNPQKLGQESPLATAYFLGRTVDSTGRRLTTTNLGQALAVELHSAAESLWGDHPPRTRVALESAIPEIRQSPETARYAYLVLELRCFNHFIKPRKLSDIWEDEAFLPGSRTEHYRDFDVAVERLGQTLLNRLHPTFRLEKPSLQSEPIGYSEKQQESLMALKAGKTVAITGAGGVGKTTLGSWLANHEQLQPTFWFTVRPTLNDKLPSLLFSLAYFLHQQGVSNLWKFLFSESSDTHNLSLLQGIVREDLNLLRQRNQTPLLCIDELDRLTFADPEQIPEQYVQILEFLESLNRDVPLLLIGQRPVLEADLYLTLTGLPQSQFSSLLQQLEIPENEFSQANLKRLYEYTQGNFRLLLLCLALYQSCDSLDQTFDLLPQSPTIQPLLNRLWPRLESEERRILQQLSVFRGHAPVDGWTAEQIYLQNLIKRRLVQLDGQGGMALLPALRELIYANLSPELRERLHLSAGDMRMERGEYTAAAYHYGQAGHESEAVQAWYPHRVYEIQRGQASAAAAIFQKISLHRLNKREQRALGELRAELHLLQGDLQTGLANIESNDWSDESESTIRVNALRGEFLKALGYPDAAVKSYGAGIATTARLLSRLTDLHHKRGVVHVRQREYKQAWREAHRAQYESQRLLGMLYEEGGQYTEAYTAYQNALALAEDLGYDIGCASIQFNLSNLCGRQQKFEDAVQHAQQAMTFYEKIGDRINLERMRSNLSAIYLQAKAFEEAIAVAKKVLPFMKAIGNSYFAATTLCNLAEACLEIGDLSNAQQYATEALDQEEPQTHPYVLYTLGLIKQTENAPTAAIEYLSYGVRTAQMNEDRYIEAYTQRALGRVYLEQGQQEQGVKALTAALQLFQQLQIGSEVAETEALLV